MFGRYFVRMLTRLSASLTVLVGIIIISLRQDLMANSCDNRGNYGFRNDEELLEEIHNKQELKKKCTIELLDSLVSQLLSKLVN
jgi:hypothetical protein